MTEREGLAGGWRLRDHPLHIIAAGGILIAAAAIGYLVPGLIFRGSVSQVHSLCDSGIGLIAQGMNESTQSGCATAENWTAGFTVTAIAGVILAVIGMILAWRAVRDAAPR